MVHVDNLPLLPIPPFSDAMDGETMEMAETVADLPEPVSLT